MADLLFNFGETSLVLAISTVLICTFTGFLMFIYLYWEDREKERQRKKVNE